MQEALRGRAEVPAGQQGEAEAGGCGDDLAVPRSYRRYDAAGGGRHSAGTHREQDEGVAAIENSD